jgi:methylated-DNA-[protein]-cysteine S-methyltransferase
MESPNFLKQKYNLLKKREISDFAESVYQTTKKITKGRISTYAEIAKQIGDEKSYRAVGNALNKNPFAPIVPCHRVVTSNGSLGGFAFGRQKKIALLKKEGIIVLNDRVLDFQDKLFVFTKHKDN